MRVRGTKVGGDGRDYETAGEGGGSLKLQEDSALGESLWGVQDIAGIRFGLGKGAQVLGPLQRLTAERPLLRTLFLSLLELTRPSFNFRGRRAQTPQTAQSDAKA